MTGRRTFGLKEIRSCWQPNSPTAVIYTPPNRILNTNRGHWSIENSCHYVIDWNYDEDRSRIKNGYGPENITRLRRFAISVIKSKGVRSVS